mmetsp:Transcript_8481/g.24306  ORF Transcript_8481/g.24306 Transcript_8481/m.24306 type:complete len:250 (-) Transcript_8481:1085-1834(-)
MRHRSVAVGSIAQIMLFLLARLQLHRLHESILSQNDLQKCMQPQRGVVRSPIIDEPLPGTQPRLKLVAAKLLYSALDVVRALEEHPCLIVNVLPAANDMVVHQQGDVKAQRLRGNAWGGVRHACDEQSARLLDYLQKVSPELFLVHLNVPALNMVLQQLVTSNRLGQHDHLVAHVGHLLQALPRKRPVAIVVVPRPSLVHIEEVVLLLIALRNHDAAPIVAKGVNKVALADQRSRDAGRQGGARVPVAV